MITNFFAPKSKSSGGKRPRETGGGDGSTAEKKRVVTPAASSVSTAATSSSSSTSSVEAAALLSCLHERKGSVAGPSWRRALEKKCFGTKKFASLAQFVAKERASKTVYPPPELTFSALNLTPLDKVKVVIVGQDPYHQPGQGHGLSFSVPRGVKIPPSLRNIYKELNNDDYIQGFTIPQHGNLERWAKQGVLLLNNVLTVRRGEAASHSKRGWEEFTDGVISAVIERDASKENAGDNAANNSGEKGQGVVFLLWGKPASAKAQTVLAKYGGSKRSRHAVITCSHPSPLGATKTSSPFMGSRCFSRANEELVQRGYAPIDWAVDGPLEEAEEEAHGPEEGDEGQAESEKGGSDEAAGDFDV